MHEGYIVTQGRDQPAAFLNFVLHAHLPYVVNHGTWPHGMEWLHEAAAETYLPLLRVLGNLERDGIAFHCNLDLSPILLEQLAHPVFVAEFPRYLTRKIAAAQEDEAFFQQSGETHYVTLARFWRDFFQQALDDFTALHGSIVAGLRHFNDLGLISVMTCCATHGYLPLLGTDESVRAQVRLAVETHERHFGQRPRGIWSPECGYRPAGEWSYPVLNLDGSPIGEAFPRAGTETIFAESALEFFVVDTHLVQGSHAHPGVYELRDASAAPGAVDTTEGGRSLYEPYRVADATDESPAVSVLPRDPRTGLQVWSGDYGYPGDARYLDFHKKRWPGGHRYWRVTGHNIDMNGKEPYQPAEAAEAVQAHAAHFAHLAWQTLQPLTTGERPPILCAPFDAELFGHWWFEGPQWLEAVARQIHELRTGSGLQLIDAATYLDAYPAAEAIAMSEGSWGAGGRNEVWLNAETGWTWSLIYPAERFVRDLVTAGAWRATELGTSIVRQLCRELLLLESSDWQFLITTGAARDYAESRFRNHLDEFEVVRGLWETFAATHSLTLEQQARLEEIAIRDSIFADLDPGLWATDARDTPPGGVL